jgi:hypothetical protein
VRPGVAAAGEHDKVDATEPSTERNDASVAVSSGPRA